MTLFVNDLPQEVESLINMFADDTKVYLPLTTNESSEQLQEDLKKLETWATQMQMRFHPQKCKVMHLGKANNKRRYIMKKADGEQHVLEETIVEKDLGVYVDSALAFTTHCQNKINTANKTLGYLRHTFKNMDSETFLLLYKALVRPHLEFSSCVWSPKYKYISDAIERVQRRATKIISNLKDLPYSERLQKLNLATLDYRRKRADLLEVYRITEGIHSIDQHCQCKICPEKYMLSPSLNIFSRGHSKKLQVQTATGIRSNYFSVRVVNAWNSLSEETVSAKNINIFKNLLHKDLGKNMFIYNFSY